jgi:dihydrofolate reductase
MRSVVLGLGISLDGYIARSDDSIDFLFMPKDYSMAPFFKTIDTAIMGRKTYEVSLNMGAAGSFKGSTKYYVVSTTLPPGEKHGAIITRQSPKSLVAEIRKSDGKNIWLMGGGILAREFLKADLVDEIYLGVLPLLIGGGIPLFPSGFPERKFELTENKTFSKGFIALRYKRARASSKPRAPKRTESRPSSKRKA